METGFSSWSNPSYEDLDKACRHIARYISFNDRMKNIDLIVGVARGGLIPAVIISHLLNVPMRVIHYSSKMGRGDDKNHDNNLPELSHHRILFIDDLIDTGNTMDEICSHYKNLGHDVLSSVIYYKEMDNQTHTPDIWAVKISKNFGWITFPFEEEHK